MKTSLIACALASVLSVQAVALPANNVVVKRQSTKKLEHPVVCIGPGGRLAPIPGAAPLRQEINDPSIPKGAKRVKIRSGPYEVPGMMTKSIMGESGALWNCGDAEIEKPCEECMLFRFQAGLEFPDGRNANIDHGMWLHHMVVLNIGPGRWDPTCYHKNDSGTDPSLPHFAVGTSPKRSERLFASGNERTPGDLTPFIKSGKKVGYFIEKTDDFRFIVDLMNMNMHNEKVYVTMTYDIFDGAFPEGWQTLTPIWLDANQCGMSDVHPTDPNGIFTISSNSWKATVEGEIAGMGTHLHDGGDVLRVLVNESTTVCNSTAKYGETPEYIYKAPADMMKGSDIHVAEKHISTMSTCYYDSNGVQKMTKGQEWIIKGDYDYTKYDGNSEGGEASEIMAIALVYVAQPRNRTAMPPLE